MKKYYILLDFIIEWNDEEYFALWVDEDKLDFVGQTIKCTSTIADKTRTFTIPLSRVKYIEEKYI